MAADFVLPIHAMVSFTRKIVKALTDELAEFSEKTKLFLKTIRERPKS